MKETKINEFQETEVLQEEQPKVQKKQSKHGIKALVALTLAFALLIGSSFAYFTDYATSQANGTAGTLAIALESDINLLDAEGRDILNPGDIRSGSFTVTNMGNKSADIRTTIALTAYDRDGNPIDLEGSNTTQSMYDLYLASDVEFIDGQGNIPKQGVQPLQTKNVNGNVITYSIPEYSLNGNSDLYDEVETITAGINQLASPFAAAEFEFGFEEEIIPGISALPEYAKDCDFVLVFNTAAGNEFQGSVVRIDVIVEAKQHENTQAGWQLCEHENITVGSLAQGVVLPENVITTNGTINPGYEYTPTPGVGGEVSEYASIRGNFTLLETYLSFGDTENFYPATVSIYDTNYDIVNSIEVTEEMGGFEFNNLAPNTEYFIQFGRSSYYTVNTGSAGSTLVLNITVTPGYM